MKRILVMLATACFAISASAEKILDTDKSIQQLQQMMTSVAQEFQKQNAAGVRAGCDKVRDFVKKFEEEDLTLVPQYTCNAYVGIVTKNQKQTCTALKQLEAIHTKAIEAAKTELVSIEQKMKADGPKDELQQRVLVARQSLQNQFITGNDDARKRTQNAMTQHKC